jgi:CheY-like chemotaxis protein
MCVRKKILVVEDDDSINRGLTGFLESEGFQVSSAKNGREALDILHDSSPMPNIILLDLKMPVMDGRDFRREQKKDPSTADIPVILMTANTRTDGIDPDHDLRAVVQKPFDIEELSKLLHCI